MQFDDPEGGFVVAVDCVLDAVVLSGGKVSVGSAATIVELLVLLCSVDEAVELVAGLVAELVVDWLVDGGLDGLLVAVTGRDVEAGVVELLLVLVLDCATVV